MQYEEDVTTERHTFRYRFNNCPSCGAPVNAGRTFAVHCMQHERPKQAPNVPWTCPRAQLAESLIQTLEKWFEGLGVGPSQRDNEGGPKSRGTREGHEEDVITERYTFRNRFNNCPSCGAPVNAEGAFAADSEGHRSGPSQRDNEGGPVKRQIGPVLNSILTCSFAPLCDATMGQSFAPSLLVLATLIALVLPQLGPMTHSEGQENFDTSLSTPTLIHEYDVFVSFRGEDTRTSFTAYLLDAFDRKRIHAYKDAVDLPRGEEIEPAIFYAIERSRIAVVVFSKNYATSRWCLDELVKIMECRRLFNQRVIPVFYDVSPSVVSEQKENFAEALLNGPMGKVNNWTTALKEAANLAGYHLEATRPEPAFIEEIVERIWKFLHVESPCRQNCVQNAGLRSIHLMLRKKETTGSCSLAPLCVATVACSFAPSLLVLATLIALVLPQLGLCAAAMIHSEGQENFDTSLSTPTYECDVFVSFCGADCRTSFIAHLLAAFDCKRICAYKDDTNLPRGEKIGLELLKAIETSKIAVVVFSKNYATSNRCLDELVKIMECKRLFNQSVIPIFYDVSPSKVRKQKGNLSEALLNGNEDQVNSWKVALSDAENLAGLHLKRRPEGESIAEIVEVICRRLKGESSTVQSRRQIDNPGAGTSRILPSNSIAK